MTEEPTKLPSAGPPFKVGEHGRSSRLHDHKPSPERKKVLRPPLRQFPLTDMRWDRDHVPNYLWAAGHLTGDVDQGLFRIARVLDAIQELLANDEGEDDEISAQLDGSLFAFEAIPVEEREHILHGLRERGLAELAAPPGFAHALRVYEDAPGIWLTALSEEAAEPLDRAKAEDYLAHAVVAILNGHGPGGTAVKATSFRQLMISGRLKMSREDAPVDELKRYPGHVTPVERSRVESFLRASFAASLAAHEDELEPIRAWSKRFWRANWDLFRCYALPDKDATDSEQPQTDAPPATNDADDVGDQLDKTWSRFLEVAYKTNPGLDDPTRHEVVSGLAAHGLRTALTVAMDPVLWAGEYGAPLLRVVAEVQIVLEWLGTAAGDDPGIYERFKEYGRGRLKLALLHTEDAAERFPAPDIWGDVLELLHEEANAEIGVEFQDISLEGTFSGIDVRKMAIAANAEVEYRLTYAPMSAVAHSEWPMLTRYAMERCMNPLHRFHWLPRSEITSAVRSMAGDAALVMAKKLLETYEAVIAKLAAVQP